MKSQYKTEQRSQLYHNKYRYRIVFKLLGGHRTYWSTSFQQFIDNMSENTLSATKYDPQQMASYFTFKRKYMALNHRRLFHPSKFNGIVITTSFDKITVFANDAIVIKQIEARGFENTVVTEAQVTIPKGIKYFAKDPKFNRRVYLRSKRVDEEFRNTLSDFLANNPDIHPSNALKLWLNIPVLARNSWHRNYLSDGHYLEFNDDGFHTLLILFMGDKYLGKYYELLKRPA